ncbi:tetratricopeptide repeat protein [Accumulibacter sp.]|uniref:tetratricopeptide repeat protein n=1 Tax=Accumulibacter sp. TaxID=2053492 RepID=UPI0025D249A6|nr:tetratricopeptide repeat protein [Accumulibacter sp.]MCM8595381.1 tetratricopeptide repeat protein [Accumulibacter sp.]MCM8626438.1 tetratricopeptide repeat protein [Accumulibacter sp.]MDS4049528.1 tetratricopeptide repeat protein [Accumulibacter sp.]
MGLKPGRNDPCPCGSGRKYKHCCLAGDAANGQAGERPPQATAAQLESLFRQGRFAELVPLLQALIVRAPDSAFLWGMLGAAQEARGEDGVAALDKAARLAPASAAARISLGQALAGRGRMADALDSFAAALAIDPANPAALFHYGDLLRTQGRFAEAEPYLARAVMGAPQSADAIISLALAQGEIGRWPDAERSCREALALAPRHRVAQYGLGNVLMRTGRLSEARDCFLAALHEEPSWIPALEGLGNALQELGSLARAEECYRQCLAIDPRQRNALANLGKLLVEQNRFAEAETCFRGALQLGPADPAILERLGSVLVELGRAAEARSCYRQVLDADPERVSARLALAVSTIPVVARTAEESAKVPERFAAALDELSAWLDSRADREVAAADLAGAQQPFFLAYRDGNHVALLSCYADLVGGCLKSARLARQPDRQRIRLLIVSSHVCRHPVWSIVLKGFLLHLDRTRFEVLIYHLGNTEDEETDLARSRADGWRDRHSIGDSAGWLAAAAQDRPDVIFYPEIGMSSLIWFLAAHRLAPLQVAGWGHPISTGLATIDLFFSGELLEPPDADAHYRERLIRLPGTGCCTSSSPGSAEPIPDIARTLQAYPGVRFVIAQRAIKFDPGDDELFTRIAAAIPDAVFIVLRDPVCPWATEVIEARFAAAFASCGLAPERHLLVLPWLSSGGFLSLLDLCDVYLDNPAFSGYTTAWLALHRGLPIVTLEGRYVRQRLAAGLLRRAGLGATIARNREQYVAIAARLAGICRDAQQKAELRAAILAAAPSVDDDLAVVRSFEQVIARELAARRGHASGELPG